MSELGDKVAGTIEWLIGERSELAEGLILQAFKAHIKGCEPPNPKHIEKKAWNDDVAYMRICQSVGIEAYRKALMESLE